MDEQRDSERARKAVKQERQRLQRAKEVLEEELDKSFSLKTLQRFLKNLSADGNASDLGPKVSQILRYMPCAKKL